MTLRCPPIFWLALSLKSRQAPHTLRALLLFTFLKCYDVKVLMLPQVIMKLYFFSTLNCFPSTYLLIHQQKKRFLPDIYQHISWRHHTGHRTHNFTRYFLIYISICPIYIYRCKNTPILLIYAPINS